MAKVLKGKKNFMVGSTGIEPATPTVSRRPRDFTPRVEKLRPARKYLIPSGFSLIPGIEWRNGRARIFHVLCEDVNPRREKSVTLRRRKSVR